MPTKERLVIFSSGDLELSVPITPERDTVWLTQEQMSALFDTARSSIAYHIGKIFRESELDQNASVEISTEAAATLRDLLALTIMIAESRPEEKETMISIIMNCIG